MANVKEIKYQKGDVETYYAKNKNHDNNLCNYLTKNLIKLLNEVYNNLNKIEKEMWIDHPDFINYAKCNLRDLKGVVFVDEKDVELMEEYETSKLGMFFVIEDCEKEYYSNKWEIKLKEGGNYILISPIEIMKFFDNHKDEFNKYKGNYELLLKLTFLHELGHMVASVSRDKYNKHRKECESFANWFASINLDFINIYLLGAKTKFQPTEYQDFFTNPRNLPGQVYVRDVDNLIIDVKEYDKKVKNMFDIIFKH